MMKIARNYVARKVLASVGLSVVVLTLTCIIQGQPGETKSDRGSKVGNAYSTGQFDSINTTNGNLMLSFQLGGLPAGRGQAKAGVFLTYNSKLYDTEIHKIRDDVRYPVCDWEIEGPLNCRYYYKSLVQPSDKGGWRVTSRYELELENRRDNYVGPVPSCGINGGTNSHWGENTYIHKLRLVSPDGSSHEMLPLGHTDYSDLKDKFYRVRPDGWILNCGVPTTRTGQAMSYYSDDGSFLRIDFSYDSDLDWGNNTWTIYYPDGSKVTGGGTTIQRVYDRNGNYVDIDGYLLTDQMGRAVTPGGNSNGSTITTKGVNGADITWTYNWKTIRVNKTFQSCADNSDCPPGEQRTPLVVDWPVIDTITEPSQIGGRVYTFSYNGQSYPNPPPGPSYGWGEVSGVTISNGPSITYAYNMDGRDGGTNGVQEDLKEIMRNYPSTKTLTHDGVTDTWSYSTTASDGSSVGPDGISTTNYFTDTGENSWKAGLTYKTESSSGTKVEKIWAQNAPSAQCSSPPYRYSCNPYVKTEYTSIKESLNGGYTLSSIKDFAYDKNGNVVEVKEYDWVPYSLTRGSGDNPSETVPTAAAAYFKRKSVTSFYNETPEASSGTFDDPDMYFSTNSRRLLRLAKSSSVLDAQSVTRSRADIEYDFTNFLSSNSKAGNPTITRTWDSTKTTTVPAILNEDNSVKSQATYNEYGLPVVTTDSNDIQTTITYGCIDGSTGCSSTMQNLYPTKTEVASNHSSLKRTTIANYDFYTGLVLSTTDVDNGTTVATNYDATGRPISVTAPDGSLTTTEYHDAERFVVVRSDVHVVGDQKKVATQFHDQIGRVRLSKTLEDASQSATNEIDGIKVETRYLTASAGNPFSYQLTSNPFRAATSGAASGEPTMGWTMSKVKNDGRESYVTTYSGSSLPPEFGGGNGNPTGTVSTFTGANSTTLTDQASKTRRSITNGLGQLTQVDEPDANGNLTLSTTYQYDALNNLTRVDQGSQQRTFFYSSLSRLISANNPESGVTGYGYDNNGNLTSKTDARLITTTYVYDALNRVTHRNYSGSAPNYVASPNVVYTYDVGQHAKGRLTKVTSGSGTAAMTTEYTGFDILGRVTSSKQTTDGQDFTSNYTYNASGALIEQTYPSGRVVKNTLDADGSLFSVQSKKSTHPTYWNYAWGMKYNAAGGLTEMQYGNGRWESMQYNERLQPTQIALGYTPNSTDQIKLNYSYNGSQNNGNVSTQTIEIFRKGLDPLKFYQEYQYDTLNRLKEAKETDITSGSNTQTWKQVFDPDRYGNRMFGAGTTTLGNCPTNVCNPSFSQTNNRITSGPWNYDAAGNTTVDGSGQQFTYDSENKQVFVKNSSNTLLGEYFYDGDGKRVKKYVPATGETTIFVYDASGRTVAEYSTVVEPPTAAKVAYLTNDHLGSPRLNTDRDGNITARNDFLPYGEEITVSLTPQRADQGYTPDTVRKQFTGYERDDESGLDFAEARMYSSSLGRFTAVDPLMASAKALNPQTWNRYVYVGNSPLNRVDPSGLDWYQQTSGGTTNYQWFDGEAGSDWTRVDFVAGNSYAPLTGASLGGTFVGNLYLYKYGNSYLNQTEYSSMVSRSLMLECGYHCTGLSPGFDAESAGQGWMGMGGAGYNSFAGTVNATNFLANQNPFLRLVSGGDTFGYLSMYEPANSGERGSYVIGSVGLAFAGAGGAAGTTARATSVTPTAKTSGYYLLEFESGKFYAGKGLEARMNQSANYLSRLHGDTVVNKQWFSAGSNRAGFVGEHNLMMSRGGPLSFDRFSPTYNKIFSPGRRYH